MSSSPGGPITVLHVDDELSFAELASEFLEREDDRLSVITETTADDGLARIETDEIDCIVSDYRMPGTDGLEFLTAVRETHPDLPFILFTGQGSEEIASDALSMGVTDYLQKETATEQYELLANRINNAVDRYRAQERAAYLERVRKIVRDVNQALVRATSRQEVETRMCEIISAPESVRFVVFSEVDPETNHIVPRTWRGAESTGSYLDAIDITIGEPTDEPTTPHERAVLERDVAASRDIQEDPAFDPWREAVDATGAHALAVVPIEYETHLYGLLALYGNRPRPVEDVRDLLEELGGDIAHAFYAIDTRRELEESESRYRNLAETASDAILRIDDSSTITYANPATEQLFGYTQDELQGASLTKLMPDQFREKHLDAIDRYLQTGERQLDWTGVQLPGRHKTGTKIPLSITFGEFEQNNQRFFTGILRDITERVERNEDLERQIEYLDEFAGTVAHDLRNPLNILVGRLELASQERDSDNIETALTTANRMEELLDDLLQFARLGQGIDKTEPIVLEDSVDSVRRAVENEAVTIETDVDAKPILGSPRSILTLLENLFRNAVEHGGSEVLIRVVRLDDGFSVEDNGPGIPEENREEVFEPGYTTKNGGTGFGLNIVEKIVDAHGWQIAVTRGDHGGARFEITGVEFAD